MTSRKDKISKDTIEVIGNVRGNLAQATEDKKARPIATQEDKEAREATGRTQGKKGCRAKRINFAFWTDTYDYVNTMARVEGYSIAKFVNIKLLELMEQDKKYKKLKAVLEEKEDDEEKDT